ncbi:MAG: hypothetical protein MRY21_03040 [Simkaniaceae bacterium]|nr:hypothetical protein [Simkaniaceae bacterium]
MRRRSVAMVGFCEIQALVKRLYKLREADFNLVNESRKAAQGGPDLR